QTRERATTAFELSKVVAHPVARDVADPADRVLEARYPPPAHERAHERVLYAVFSNPTVAGCHREGAHHRPETPPERVVELQGPVRSRVPAFLHVRPLHVHVASPVWPSPPSPPIAAEITLPGERGCTHAADPDTGVSRTEVGSPPSASSTRTSVGSRRDARLRNGTNPGPRRVWSADLPVFRVRPR